MAESLLPTSARRLRELARLARMDAEAAERALDRAVDRAEAAEAEVDAAARGIAPPGFYLVGEEHSDEHTR
jgi:hypothetical protein